MFICKLQAQVIFECFPQRLFTSPSENNFYIELYVMRKTYYRIFFLFFIRNLKIISKGVFDI